MSRTVPRAVPRASWLGLLLVCALSLGQVGILSAHADDPADPPPSTDATEEATVAPAIVDEGSVEPDRIEPTATVTDAEDADPSDASTGADGTTEIVEAAPAATTPTATTTTPPDLQVTKTSNAVGVQGRGDRFTYTITVTNAGTEEATGVEIHDELPPGLDVLVPLPSFQGAYCTVASSVVSPGIPFTTVDCGPRPLDGGASASIGIDVRVNGDTCGTIANAVDVRASNEPPGNVGADNHAEATDELECVPRIRLQKSGPSLAHVGDRLTFVFRVSNTGGVDLDAVEIDDPLCDRRSEVTGRGDGDASLSPGERWSFSCPHTVTRADGDVVHNVATATASFEGGAVTDADGHDVDVIHPDLAIVATATPASGPAGTSIAFTFAVTNTGDTGLHHVSVDDVHGHVGTIPSLAPGRTVELTVADTLGSSPATNVATAAGADALGRAVRASDGVTVAVVSTGGAGGTPFTGADTGPPTIAIAVLTLSGLGLLVATGRRRRTA